MVGPGGIHLTKKCPNLCRHRYRKSDHRSFIFVGPFSDPVRLWSDPSGCVGRVVGYMHQRSPAPFLPLCKILHSLFIDIFAKKSYPRVFWDAKLDKNNDFSSKYSIFSLFPDFPSKYSIFPLFSNQKGHIFIKNSTRTQPFHQNATYFHYFPTFHQNTQYFGHVFRRIGAVYEG